MRRTLLALVLAASVAIAETVSTTVMWTPIRPMRGTSSSWPGTDTIRCVSFVAEMSITNATQMAWSVTGGLGANGKCSFGIYSADGSTLVRSSGAVPCEASAPVEVTALSAFSLVEGTKYLVCTCANTNGGNYLGADAVAGNITSLQNVFGSAPIGLSTTSTCTNGALPSSLADLAAATVNAPILLVATTPTTTTSTTTSSTTSTTL